MRFRNAMVLIGCGLLAACASRMPATPAAPNAPDAPDAAWAGWSEFTLPGKRSTVYSIQRVDGRSVVQARAESSASMWRRSVSVEPAAIGAVDFSWRIAGPIADADLADRDAEDSPVRLVFAFDGDTERLTNKDRMMSALAQSLTGEPLPFATLMYVWDNHAPVGTVLKGNRSDRIRKIVLESGPQQSGRWLNYRRDLAADFHAAFGEAPGRLVGIALMTDADNTRSSALGHYGEVRLLGPEAATAVAR